MDNSKSTEDRPDQGKFDQDQIKFLKTFLDDYKAYGEELAAKGSGGAKGLKGVKGSKKEWILKRMYPAYVKHFNITESGGPNLQTLKDVSD